MKAFGAFVSDFFVGDDPWIAVVVVAALGLTALAVQAGRAGWVVLPVCVLGVLAWSVLRAARR